MRWGGVGVGWDGVGWGWGGVGLGGGVGVGWGGSGVGCGRAGWGFGGVLVAVLGVRCVGTCAISPKPAGGFLP